MIDVQEHFYDDDPAQGHPDVRTRLKDVSYFFLGNGYIQAAVQIAPSGEGTPAGLLIMNPEYLRKKREALTLDPDSGLENTMVRVRSVRFVDVPGPGNFEAKWSARTRVPAVEVLWHSERFEVEEYFYCPDRSRPVLIREVRIKNLTQRSTRLRLHTGILRKTLEREFVLGLKEEKKVYLRYTLNDSGQQVNLDFIPEGGIDQEAVDYWEEKAHVSFESSLLDHYFKASQAQLPAVISRTGRVDGSIWQYNREWVRDQAMLAVGLTLSGHQEKARTMLTRLFEKFVTVEGDTIDSSEKRDIEEVELDQNGVLLYALKNYIQWTGDFSLVEAFWDKIRVTAEYPLKDVFRHKPSGLLANTREYWERHRVHGIKKGMELAHQFFTVVGLSSAASLARIISREVEASHWEKEAERIKQAFLYERQSRLVDRRGLIKRRRIDGPFQEIVEPLPEARLPGGVPLSSEGIHFLNPDASTSLPIAMGFLSPDSPLASATMKSLEALWNQVWEGGGYCRYNMSSEPDSPGPWPFPSLFIARAYVETEDFDKVWRILEWLNTIPGAQAGSWFEFYGERLSPPFPQVGIIPWAWAEMLILLVHHIIGVQPGIEHLKIRPKLLPGIDIVEASFPLREGRLHLRIRKGPKGRYYGFRSSGRIVQSSEKEVILPYQEGDIWVDAFMR